MNLPILKPHPNNQVELANYQDTQVINTLDGFNLQPRLSIPFDGPIDVNSVNSNDVFLVRMGDTLDCRDHDIRVVGINQIVWDPDTNTLHVESDELLDQHSRDALIVTDGVHDAHGRPVKADTDFRREPLRLLCSPNPVLRSYGRDLTEGLVAACLVGVRPQNIAVASVFTTQSTTSMLEKIRDQIHGLPDASTTADFNLGLDGERTVFDLNDLTHITFNQQRSVDGTLTPVSLDSTFAFLVIPTSPTWWAKLRTACTARPTTCCPRGTSRPWVAAPARPSFRGTTTSTSPCTCRAATCPRAAGPWSSSATAAGVARMVRSACRLWRP